ncbi:CopG family transcriptional regulator, partial [Sulfolobus sp. F1]
MEKITRVNDTTFIIDIEKSTVVSFKLDDNLLEIIDYLVSKFNYNCRSDLIREAIYEYLK